MEYIMLCGGMGSRLDQEMFPKPMTMVAGLPMYQRVIFQLAQQPYVTNLTIVMNQYLDKFNFRQLVCKYCEGLDREITLKFFTLPYDTQGPQESLLLYLQSEAVDNRIITVLDNDNLYIDLESTIHLCVSTSNISTVQHDGMLVTRITNSLRHYCFVDVNDSNEITAIYEKSSRGKSQKYIAVGYVLHVTHENLSLMEKCIQQSTESYMSKLYQSKLSTSINPISAYEVTAITLGTKEDIRQAEEHLITQDKLIKPIAIFDLDNTLIDTEYKRLDHQCFFMESLKARGWKIIIYTARAMKNIETQSNEETRRRWLKCYDQTKDLSYDSIVFAKPYGDIYIDDKAFNPYDNNFQHKLGFYPAIVSKRCLIRESYKSITKYCKKVQAEMNYYNTIHHTDLSCYFPKLIRGDTDFIEIEYIPGPTLSQLYLEDMLTESVFVKLLDVMDKLHAHSSVDDICITAEDILEFYRTKLVERHEIIRGVVYSNNLDANLDTNSDNIDTLCASIQESLNHIQPEVCNIIHGDLWFRNIIYTRSSFKLIDMRGKIGSSEHTEHTEYTEEALTLKGDKLYDYAKIYQSLLGMDHILANRTLPDDNLRKCFETRYASYMKAVKILTVYTMYCSLPSWISSDNKSLLDLLAYIKFIHKSI